LNDWIKTAISANIPALTTYAETLNRYKTEILNYFDIPITTSKVEGINNKIKVLKRKVYGFGDIAYFTLKIYDLHNLSPGFV